MTMHQALQILEFAAGLIFGGLIVSFVGSYLGAKLTGQKWRW